MMTRPIQTSRLRGSRTTPPVANLAMPRFDSSAYLDDLRTKAFLRSTRIRAVLPRCPNPKAVELVADREALKAQALLLCAVIPGQLASPLQDARFTEVLRELSLRAPKKASRTQSETNIAGTWRKTYPVAQNGFGINEAPDSLRGIHDSISQRQLLAVHSRHLTLGTNSNNCFESIECSVAPDKRFLVLDYGTYSRQGEELQVQWKQQSSVPLAEFTNSVTRQPLPGASLKYIPPERLFMTYIDRTVCILGDTKPEPRSLLLVRDPEFHQWLLSIPGMAQALSTRSRR